MTISSERPQEAFESIDLIKKDLGIATDGADVLKQTPGVSVTRQGGTASDPILRGLGGTRLNISIDGVPFGGVCNHRMDPATAYVSPGSFDQLILLKGPQSVTNGNNISGAVNFERDAIRYDDIGYTPDEDTLLEFSGLTSNGVIGNATIHMDVTKLDRENYDLHFKKENIASWLQEIDLRYNYTQVDHDMDNFSYRSPPPGDDYNLMSQFWQRHFGRAQITADITPDIEIVGGIDYKNDNYEGKGAGGDPLFSPPPDNSNEPFNPLVDFDNFGAYSEVQYQMNEALRWVSGFRVDTLGTTTGTMHKACEISNIVLTGSNQHRRQTLFAGFLRSEYVLDELPIMMSAGYGHAERAADYWEVYSFDGFALDAEKNNEFDAMINYRGEAFSAEFSLFYSYITDFIIVKDGDSAFNINAQRTGGELLLAYNFTDNFSIDGNLSYVYAENITQDTPLPQTPPLEGNIGLQYDDGVFYGKINTRLVAAQDRIQSGYGNVLALDTTPTAGFVTAALQLGYTPPLPAMESEREGW
jgi:iron complex outermembrane receptor protein